LIATNDLVNWYLAEQREWRQRDQGHTLTGWRSSGLGYCLRKQTYARLGVPAFREFDAVTLRTFSYGDMIHDWLKGIYRDAGLLIEEEGGLTLPGRGVTGHYDMLTGGEPQHSDDLLPDSPDEHLHLFTVREALRRHLNGPQAVSIDEIKSTSEWGMKARRKEGPQFAHKMQVGAYMLMANADPTQLPAVPTTGRVIYVSKDSKSDILEFELEGSWVEQVDQIIDELNAHWAAGTLPPCTCEGWSVGYCDYLKPSARTFLGKPKKDITGGVDCCAPELFDEHKESAA
jgi:hypothetical protein